MILALKILAMWTMVSFAAALVIGPWLREMRRSQTVAVTETPDREALPGRSPIRSEVTFRSGL